MNIAQAIKEAAEKHGLDPKILAALVAQESSGEPDAFRFERGFYRRYIKGKSASQLGETITTLPWMINRILRASSFGLGQVMGQTAIEHGFSGELWELFDVSVNLDISARILADCIEKGEGDIEEGLLRYNGGGDPTYPTRVLSHLDDGRAYALLGLKGIV